MKLLIILEYGIPEYRKFLFEELSDLDYVSELLVVNTGRIYSANGNFQSKKIKFIGNNKFGFHLGILRYIRNYDLIISSYNLRMVSCWLPSLIFLNKKWIFWGKGLGENESWLVSIIRKITANRANIILVYNDFKKWQLIEKLKISPDKVISVNNTIKIDNPGFSESFEPKHFLYFGRIQERKGLSELLIFYQEYIQRNQNKIILSLRFVGEGEYKNKLINEVNERGLASYVEFYKGEYEDDKIKKHFENAIAYVSPYNVGLGIVNSFAYGVPVITVETKQVGPEFNYLNSANSIVCKNIKELPNAFSLCSDGIANKLFKKECLNFYYSNLNHSVMVENFKKAIVSLKE